MKNLGGVKGHIAAIITILIWGTAFVSTRVLLNSFAPIEIIFYRFIIGFGVLLAASRGKIERSGLKLKQEILFAAAGLTGIALYFLLENMALTLTSTSNVGVIISIAPLFTALLAHFFLKGEKLRLRFFIGFIAAIIGISLITFNGMIVLDLNPLGDILAISAALVWAVYSILTRKISQLGFGVIYTTRKIFMYGLIFIIPVLLLSDFKFGFERFTQVQNLINILFLGLGASALCFATWNFAVKSLGAVKTSVYIYMVPVITVIASVIILNEKLTVILFIGIALTLIGLFLSERSQRNVNEIGGTKKYDS